MSDYATVLCGWCGTVLTGRQLRHCSDACRMALKRTAQPEQTKPEQPKANSAALGPELVPNEKVYGRRAVRYDLSEPWDLRPEPDSPDDVPVLDNRGLYRRPDGSAYQIDAMGTAHSIDYEGRRKNHAKLKDWAECKGTLRQQVMGQLSLTYNKGLDMNSYLKDSHT